jgi:hypothetical protein
MEGNKKTSDHERESSSDHSLAPMTLVRHSGKAACIGAMTGAVLGAVAGAVAGTAAWGMWVLGREAVKALRDRARL